MLMRSAMGVLAEGAGAGGTSFWTLVVNSVKHSSPVENSILLLLLVCSILSWALVIWKMRTLSQAKAGAAAFLGQFSKANSIGEMEAKVEGMPRSPQGLIYTAAVEALADAKGKATGAMVEQRVTTAMDHACREEFTRMHRGLDILASIASSTPFIGLFGTVLGIMATFQALGSAKSASLNVVAPGIAAALIATAAGLAVAIPAVFLYNWLMARMDEQQEQAEMFAERLEQWLVAAGAYQHTDGNAHPIHHTSPETNAVRVGR